MKFSITIKGIKKIKRYKYSVIVNSALSSIIYNKINKRIGKAFTRTIVVPILITEKLIEYLNKLRAKNKYIKQVNSIKDTAFFDYLQIRFMTANSPYEQKKLKEIMLKFITQEKNRTNRKN